MTIQIFNVVIGVVAFLLGCAASYGLREILQRNSNNVIIEDYESARLFTAAREINSIKGNKLIDVKMTETSIRAMYAKNGNPPTHKCLLEGSLCNYRCGSTCDRIDNECIFCDTKENRKILEPMVENHEWCLYKTTLGGIPSESLEKADLTERIKSWL